MTHEQRKTLKFWEEARRLPEVDVVRATGITPLRLFQTLSQDVKDSLSEDERFYLIEIGTLPLKLVDAFWPNSFIGQRQIRDVVWEKTEQSLGKRLSLRSIRSFIKNASAHFISPQHGLPTLPHENLSPLITDIVSKYRG